MLLNGYVDLKGLMDELNAIIPLEKITINKQTYPVDENDLQLIEFILQYKAINPTGYHDELLGIFTQIAQRENQKAQMNNIQDHNHECGCTECSEPPVYQAPQGFDTDGDEFDPKDLVCIQDLYNSDYTPKSDEEFEKFTKTCNLCSNAENCLLMMHITTNFYNNNFKNLIDMISSSDEINQQVEDK